MFDYIFFMHNDSPHANQESVDDAWGPYLAKLKASGCFDGGSEIGTGVCVNKAGKSVELSSRVVGDIRVRADNLARAQALLVGNPVFEAGGTVEIRELPKT